MSGRPARCKILVIIATASLVACDAPAEQDWPDRAEDTEDDFSEPEPSRPEIGPADELTDEPDIAAANWSMSVYSYPGGTSAWIGWGVNSPPPVDYEVCWKRSDQWGGICGYNALEITVTQDHPGYSPAAGRQYIGINGLQCDTEYQVRIRRSRLSYDTATFTSSACECLDPCPSGGWYDGANCQMGQAPAGTTAFIYANNYYYTALPGNSCPYPGSWYDGANCYVQAVPVGANPFIWANHWYYASCP